MTGHISGMDVPPIDMAQNGYELMRYQVDYMILTFDHSHDFDFVFSWSKFEITVFQERVLSLTWDEREKNR